MSMSMSMMMNAYVPPTNYATWNPLDKGVGVVLSGGNLTVSRDAIGGESVRSTVGVSSGKWYWEQTIVSGTNIFFEPGVGTLSADIQYRPGTDINGWGITHSTAFNNDGFASLHNGVEFTFFRFGIFSVGDVISLLLDATNGTLEMWQNGISRGVAFASGITGTVYAMSTSGDAFITTANFGASPFVYSVPVGYNSGLYA